MMALIMCFAFTSCSTENEPTYPKQTDTQFYMKNGMDSVVLVKYLPTKTPQNVSDETMKLLIDKTRSHLMTNLKSPRSFVPIEVSVVKTPEDTLKGDYITSTSYYAKNPLGVEMKGHLTIIFNADGTIVDSF